MAVLVLLYQNSTVFPFVVIFILWFKSVSMLLALLPSLKVCVAVAFSIELSGLGPDLKEMLCRVLKA